MDFLNHLFLIILFDSLDSFFVLDISINLDNVGCLQLLKLITEMLLGLFDSLFLGFVDSLDSLSEFFIFLIDLLLFLFHFMMSH